MLGDIVGRFGVSLEYSRTSQVAGALWSTASTNASNRGNCDSGNWYARYSCAKVVPEHQGRHTAITSSLS
ncbi:hypothetical protein E2C01_053255 [Portunus trituberculatus]|uniref:Uncharacterized protein n=1 Tax=Portunus trituberculatus TaxID=210409 RepID=A0A5B7GNP1_PORTR|nr:hypothetical protein [Portunus trituberculatus]